ncbi:MAG: hypothetical protein N4A33_04690 [Bacteriovoracaceae bacterium]|jgi:hypothetical protein|nr:hypothetical protein [Bacteriovoracaceae bacterium]
MRKNLSLLALLVLCLSFISCASTESVDYKNKEVQKEVRDNEHLWNILHNRDR